VAQRVVEILIGRLITDEAFRMSFRANPLKTLTDLSERGFDLTSIEVAALVESDPSLWEQAAERLDPRLQKASLVSNQSSHKASSHHV
jgi:hypothetical protein